jgi:hypothetical protein
MEIYLHLSSQCEKGERCSIKTSISPGRNFLPHLRPSLKNNREPRNLVLTGNGKARSGSEERDTRLQSKKIKLEAAKLGLLGSTEIITPEMPPLPLKDA